MKINCQTITSRLRSSSMVFATAALLSITCAGAQMTPGAGGQTSPGQQTTPGTQPGTQPGMSPMDQATRNDGQDPNGAASMMDKAFVRTALQGGMAEVQLGQLAAQKGNSDDVKQFGQKMVDDHTKLADQLKPIAEQMGIKPPTSLSSKDKATMAKLQALNGDAFDKAYIKDMVKDHTKDEKDFKQEADRTTNEQLKQCVTQGAQVISEHLQMIKQIAQKNNVTASK